MNTLLLLAALVTDTTAVRLAASPDPVWIEQKATWQSLNFDLLVENPTSTPLDVDEIQLSVYDSKGRLVQRRFLDGNGTRPSIRTIDAEVPAQGTALIFNPFERFEKEVDLTRLVYEVALSGKSGSPTFHARVVVEPRPYATKTKLILPVTGRLLVYDGHDFYAHHRRWDYTIPDLRALGFHTNFMRYSYDLVAIDEQGRTSNGDESRNQSWLGFGRELRAAGDGTIAAVMDERPDDRSFDPSKLGGDTMKIWGNYLVIDHGNGEFSLYGHIRQGSSRVKVGQRVKQGDVVAAMGASGSSMFPHLHYELQTNAGTDSEGLPSTFLRFDRLLGSKRIPVESGTIDSGDIVESR
jgi:hypothetical protein